MELKLLPKVYKAGLSIEEARGDDVFSYSAIDQATNREVGVITRGPDGWSITRNHSTRPERYPSRDAAEAVVKAEAEAEGSR